jgi:hypothetical protein
MKSIVAFLLLILSLSLAQAQLRIGVTVSPALTGALNLDVTQRKGMLHIPTLGWGVGVPISYDGHKGRGIQTGIYYASTNQSFIFKYTLAGEDYTLRGKKRFDFIKVPVMYRKSGRIAKFVRTSFAIGLQYSYTLKFAGGMTVYDPDVFFDTPPNDVQYFKRHTVDGAIQWGTEIAIKKRLDLFTGLKVDISIPNMAKKNAPTYFGYQVFGKGLGWHPYSVNFQVGILYVLSRQDHMNLPGNTYRFRPYKRKPSQMRK